MLKIKFNRGCSMSGNSRNKRCLPIILFFLIWSFYQTGAEPAEDYGIIDEESIVSKIEKEIGAALYEKESPDKIRQNENKKASGKIKEGSGRILAKLCSGREIEGLLRFQNRSISVSPENIRGENSVFRIPFGIVRKFEIAEWEKVYDAGKDSVFYFPKVCSIALKGGLHLSGICEWKNWLKITIFTADSIRDLYTFYSEKKENSEPLKNIVFGQMNKMDVLCSVEILDGTSAESVSIIKEIHQDAKKETNH